jgi:hypothetical protein
MHMRQYDPKKYRRLRQEPQVNLEGPGLRHRSLLEPERHPRGHGSTPQTSAPALHKPIVIPPVLLHLFSESTFTGQDMSHVLFAVTGPAAKKQQMPLEQAK